MNRHFLPVIFTASLLMGCGGGTPAKQADASAKQASLDKAAYDANKHLADLLELEQAKYHLGLDRFLVRVESCLASYEKGDIATLNSYFKQAIDTSLSQIPLEPADKKYLGVRFAASDIADLAKSLCDRADIYRGRIALEDKAGASEAYKSGFQVCTYTREKIASLRKIVPAGSVNHL